MAIYTVEVDGKTYSKKSATREYPVAIIQTWTETLDSGEKFPRIVVSFAGSVAKGEAEIRTRANWQSKYPEKGYALRLVETTASN